MDIVIGFNTGDLIWFGRKRSSAEAQNPIDFSIDPISSRYVRLNKGGCISSSSCTAVHWVPHSRSLFMVSHADGSIIVYDKEREDSNFTPRDPNVVLSHAEPTYDHDTDSSNHRSGYCTHVKNIADSSLLYDMVVTPGPSGNLSGGSVLGVSTKDKALKNPISHWRVSRKAIHGAPRCV